MTIEAMMSSKIKKLKEKVWLNSVNFRDELYIKDVYIQETDTHFEYNDANSSPHAACWFWDIAW